MEPKTIRFMGIPRSRLRKIGIDDGVEGTLWDNGTIGNYWGDYNGTDNNNDGIGDTHIS